MSTPSIQVLGISAEEQDFAEFENGQKPQSQLRLHGRVTVFDQDGSFDTVHIQLQGAIRTQIGSKVAVEQLLSSTQTRKHVDFKPTYSASRQSIEEQQLDFVFPIPSTIAENNTPLSPLNCLPDGFIPSMSLVGSTYVTRVTALKDRHLVEGSCQVVYWMEATLLRSDTNRILRRLSCPVDISSLHVPLNVQVSNQAKETHVEQVVTTRPRGLTNILGSKPQPELIFRMRSHLGTISSDPAKFATKGRHLTIPATVSLDLPAGFSAQSLSSLQANTLRCSVKAHWYTSRAFSTMGLAQTKGNTYTNNAAIVRNNTVSMQKVQVTLPPLYNSGSIQNTGATRFSTSMDIELVLPESVASPSIAADLLSISYVLELSMKFEFENETFMRACAVDFSLPVTLSSAQPTSILSLQGPGSLSGFVEEGLMFAPPPYVS